MSTLKPSVALLRSMQRPPSNPELIGAYLSGAMPTKGPTKSTGRSQQFLTAFAHRRPQRRPHAVASQERRRKLGGSSGLPDTIRHHYTEGERAALFVVSSEVRKYGFCDLPLDRIAAVAGVGRTTVQNALREARRLDHVSIELRPRRGQKNDTNIVRIVSREWLAWLKRGPSIGFKTVNPTKNQVSRSSAASPERSQKRSRPARGKAQNRALEREEARCTGQTAKEGQHGRV